MISFLMTTIGPKWLGVGAAVIGLLLVLGYQGLSILRLERDLALCGEEKAGLELDILMHHAAVTELEAAVRDQNMSIADYRAELERRDDAMISVQRRIEEIRRDRIEAVANLARTQGSSCEDGIELIDKELGL